VEVVASLSQGRTAAGQCGLFTHKSVPVIFEPPCNYKYYAFNWTEDELKSNVNSKFFLFYIQFIM